MSRVHPSRAPALLGLAALAASACADTGQRYVAIPLRGEGVADAPIEAGEWTVALDRADVSLGPLWLCATEAASPELCEVAVLELTETVAIDALDPSARELATMHGTLGTVRSAMFDYGISWLPTETRARANEGAIEGRSAIFAGRATHADGRTFAFEAPLEIAPIMQGALAVNALRVGAHEIRDEEEALVARIDPRPILRSLDLDRMHARAALGEDPVVLAPGDPDYEALVIAMTARAAPTFEWRSR